METSMLLRCYKGLYALNSMMADYAARTIRDMNKEDLAQEMALIDKAQQAGLTGVDVSTATVLLQLLNEASKVGH